MAVANPKKTICYLAQREGEGLRVEKEGSDGSDADNIDGFLWFKAGHATKAPDFIKGIAYMAPSVKYWYRHWNEEGENLVPASQPLRREFISPVIVKGKNVEVAFYCVLSHILHIENEPARIHARFDDDKQTEKGTRWLFHTELSLDEHHVKHVMDHVKDVVLRLDKDKAKEVKKNCDNVAGPLLKACGSPDGPLLEACGSPDGGSSSPAHSGTALSLSLYSIGCSLHEKDNKLLAYIELKYSADGRQPCWPEECDGCLWAPEIPKQDFVLNIHIQSDDAKPTTSKDAIATFEDAIKATFEDAIKEACCKEYIAILRILWQPSNSMSFVANTSIKDGRRMQEDKDGHKPDYVMKFSEIGKWKFNYYPKMPPDMKNKKYFKIYRHLEDKFKEELRVEGQMRQAKEAKEALDKETRQVKEALDKEKRNEAIKNNDGFENVEKKGRRGRK